MRTNYDDLRMTSEEFQRAAWDWTKKFYFNRERQFTFRDVMNKLGIPSCNENNWAVGQILVRMAAKQGIEPTRILTIKTDPNPTVAAPHCIAHYPMRIFETACAVIDEHWDGKTRQLTMEF